DVEYALRAPEIKRRSALPLQRDADVFEHRQVRETGGNLERSRQSEPRHPGGGERRGAGALGDHPPSAGTPEFREKVEAGRLAGVIGSDQRMNGAARNLQADRVDGNEAGKFLGEILSVEDEIVAHDAMVPLVDHSVTTSRAS